MYKLIQSTVLGVEKPFHGLKFGCLSGYISEVDLADVHPKPHILSSVESMVLFLHKFLILSMVNHHNTSLTV